VRKHVVALASLLCAAALIGVVAGAQLPAQAEPAVPAPQSDVTAGAPPLAKLPDGAQPIRAVADGANVIVLARPSSSTKVTLYTVTPRGAVSARALPIENGGQWAGLTRSEDGTIWVGALSSVLALARDGTTRRFDLPQPEALLAPPFAGPMTPTGPIETGQITALGILGDLVYVGRVGAPELTTIDRGSGAIAKIALPAGTGDVSDIIPGVGAELLFTVNHSARIPGVLNDTLGHITGAGAVRADARAVQSVGSNGQRISVGAADLSLEEPGRGTPLARSAGKSYDLSLLAMRSDDTTAVRVAGDHALALVKNGSELKRSVYQVPIGTDRAGKPRPYIGRLAFLVRLPDGFYFALQGLPNVYRAD